MSRSSSLGAKALFAPGTPTMYVQSLHDFLPDNNEQGIYLPFNAGEVLKVYNKEKSGWWDGEAQGRRGWFPSNYVAEVELDEDGTPVLRPTGSHSARSSVSSSAVSSTSSAAHDQSNSDSPVRSSTREVSSPRRMSPQSILDGIIHAIALLENSILAKRITHFQPSTACVISSIRTVLSATDCMSKDSEVLRAHPVLGKERTQILKELSRLVDKARLASAPGLEDASRRREEESMLRMAKVVLGSVKRFLACAVECGVQLPLERVQQSKPSRNDRDSTASIDSTPKPVSPRSRRRTSSSSVGSRGEPGTSRNTSMPRAPPGSNKRLQEKFKTKDAAALAFRPTSMGDLRGTRRASSDSHPSPMPESASYVSALASARSTASSSHSVPASSGSQRGRQTSGLSVNVSVDSTSSADESPHGPLTPVPLPVDANGRIDILAAVSAAEDSLLSVIAAFIGHVHSHSPRSHPSSHAHMLDLTRETIDTVRELLTVVEAVARHPKVRGSKPRELGSLRQSKGQLYEHATKLVEGAENLVQVRRLSEEASDESEDQNKSLLLHSATSTLRSGTECVRLVRLCISRSGHHSSVDLNLNALTKPVGHGGDAPQLLFTSFAEQQQTPPAHPREKVVGIRGDHTLSGLDRKAASVSNLKKRYQQDGQLSISSTSWSHDDDEEEEIRDVSDEDATVQPAFDGSLRDALVDQQTPQNRSRPFSSRSSPQLDTTPQMCFARTVPTARSRASSLTSPAPARFIPSRSPSRSADLDSYSGDINLPDKRSSRGSSTTSYTSTDPSATSETGTAETSTRSSDENSKQSRARDLLQLASPRMGQAAEQPFKLRGLRISQSSSQGAQSPTAASPRSISESPRSASNNARIWPVSHDYSPRDVCFNSDGHMIGASLDVLVEKMTPHATIVDANFHKNFFLTFRLFVSPPDLLAAVIKRYELQPKAVAELGERDYALWLEQNATPVRLRIHNFMKAWLDSHWRHATDACVLPSMINFTKSVMSLTLPGVAPRLIDSITRRMASGLPQPAERRMLDRSRSTDAIKLGTPSHQMTSYNSLGFTFNQPPPTPIMTKSLITSLRANAVVSVTDFDALELARQFSIMESRLYCQIAGEDLLQTCTRSVPEVKAMSALSTQITGWVSDSILNEQDAKKRALLLKFFIKLADRLLLLQNFSGMWSVLAGLNTSTILRLKKTWAVLSSKYQVVFEKLRSIIDYSKNHDNYRRRLRNATAPALPFLGLMLSDITFTVEGNPDRRPSTVDSETKLINHDKYTKLAKIACDFQRFQVPYNLGEIVEVQTFLKRVLNDRGSGSVDALYRKSLLLEPRQGQERIAGGLERPAWLKL